MKALAIFATILAAYWLGYVVAHVTVATECRRLGSFYVGKSTFKCVEIKEKSTP